MIARAFEDVGATDIENLIANRVAEHRTLEYKRQLPVKTRDGSHELLADVSSFANAQGGDILYGIEEKSGLPNAIRGINVENRDAEQLKLENQLYAGIEPRLPGLRSRWIDCGEEGFVFLVRVPPSNIGPHRVISGKSNAFYGRKSNGRYPRHCRSGCEGSIWKQSTPPDAENFQSE
jgi:predicted HTH transcriptional regulator